MGYPTKIATCCYCGSKAALVLDRARHELTCASCGAPLHDMKRFRTEPQQEPRRNIPAYQNTSTRSSRRQPIQSQPPVRRKKRRKGLFRHLIEEAVDVLEDIFD